MPRIFDNIAAALLPALQDTLRISQRADFCVGYLKPGARRIVSIEVRPGPGETSEELLAHTKRTWAAAWAKVRIPA